MPVTMSTIPVLALAAPLRDQLAERNTFEAKTGECQTRCRALLRMAMVWLNTTTGIEWRCQSAAVGAALWVPTLSSGMLLGRSSAQT
jgi:hypothetical protein